jgi:hypothetical protein
VGPGPGTSDPSALGNTQAARFITSLYLDLLHRLPQAAEVTSWVNVLASGRSWGQVALLFTSSTEYRIDQVTADYRQYLGRNPESNALAGWVGALQAGFSEDWVRAQVLASPEAYGRSGGRPDQWVKYAYENALGRDPEPTGLAGWTNYLQRGGSRPQAALSLLSSPEAHRREVRLDYPELLARPVDPGAVAWWGQALDFGLTNSQLLAALAGSPEYLAGPAAADLPPLGSQAAGVMDAAGANGIQVSDGLANDPLLVARGTGSAWVPFALTVDGLPQAYARIGSDGSWNLSLPAPLLEGLHVLAAQPVAGTATVDPNNTFPIGVALTPPHVQVSVPGGHGTSTPSITVNVTPNPLAGLFGLVHVNVDLNHDGNFTDPREQDQTLAPPFGASNSAQVTLNPLAPGTYQVQVRVGDLAGNFGVSQTFTLGVNPGGPATPISGGPRKIMTTLTQVGTSNQYGLSQPQGPMGNGLGSQGLADLMSAFMSAQSSGTTPPAGSGSGSSNPQGPTGPSGPSGPQPPSGSGFQSVADLVAYYRSYYVFNADNNVLIRVRFNSLASLSQALDPLKAQGMTGAQVVKQQNLVTGFMPVMRMMSLPQLPGFLAATPVYAAIHNVGAVTTQGDGAMGADQYRSQAGVDGTGITVGAISDSVNQIDSHVTPNSGVGVAQSQFTGDLPASGVNILQDGTTTDTDEGRGILEIVHDVAPGAKLAFSSADGGPQAMAQGIVALATQANARVIVDDVTFPDEPFFNDGLVAKAVNQVVNQNQVLYVTSAGNTADHAWSDQFRPTTASVGGLTGTFENFDSGSGQKVLQHFSLAKGQTLNLSFQWDAPFLEGGTPDPRYQVPNNLGVLVTDANGTQVLRSFDDDTVHTGEALQRVIFTNDGSFGTTDFALAFQLVAGPAPTLLKWIRFDNGTPAEFQGAPTVFGHAGAAGALTVGAVPYYSPQTPETFSSQGSDTILFDAGVQRLKTPEVRNKPDVAGPDQVNTANFPGLPAGTSLPPGTWPVFTGTSAAAAHVAGVAALLEQKTPGALSKDVAQALVKSGDSAASGWNKVVGTGMIQLAPSTVAAAPPSTAPLKVGPNVDVSWNVKANPNFNAGQGNPGGGLGGGSNPSAGGAILNSAPNVDVSQRMHNEEEVDIAVDPSNPSRLFIASNQDTEFGTSTPEGLFAAFSTDGGATWTGRFMADGTDGITDKACCDPSVAFDEFGNLFLTYLNDAATLAVLALSTDGGKSFKELTSFTAQDQPKVTTGQGAVWVVFNNGDIEAAGAAVTGLGSVGSFGAVETVPNSSGGNFGNISVGPKGQVMVSFQDSGSGAGPQTIHIAVDPDGLGPSGFNNPIAATSTNVGAFRDIPALVPGPHSAEAASRVAYDRSNGPHRGRVYLDYLDAADTTTNALDVFVRFSDDDGLTWSSPVRVNDDTSGNSHFFPRLAVDQSTGNVAVSWYDCRNDHGSGPGDTDGKPNTDAEIFATVSLNGGASYFPNVQIAAGPSNANDAPDPFGTAIGYGDYTGLVFANGVFHPSWADNSNSTGNNPDGSLSGMDAYTAAVTLASIVQQAQGGLVIKPDLFEPNDTSERAAFLGTLAGTQSFPGIGLAPDLEEPFDYDWFRWTAAVSGTFTVTLTNIQAGGGDIHTRVYTLGPQDTLVELGSSRLIGGVKTQTVSVPVAAGEPLLVWVYGFNHVAGNYDLLVNLQ